MRPGIQSDVLLDDRIGYRVEDRMDEGFRLGPSPHEGVIAQRLFQAQMPICDAPSYFEKHVIPDPVAAFASHRCSAYRRPSTGMVVPWRIKVSK